MGSALIVALLGTAAAQTVDVNIDPTLAEAAGIDAEPVTQELEAAVSGKLHLDDYEGFLAEMANAAAMSTRGMGVDYATNPQRFVVGGSVGSAVSGAGLRFGRGGEDVPQGGFAFAFSGMAGLNLGIFSPDQSFLRRLVVYGNGMALTTSLAPFDGTFLNYGAHLQVQIARPPGRGGTVEWGGLALTSGYSVSQYALRLRQALPIEASQVVWDATGTYTIEAASTTVPVELSSNLRIFLATLYGGVGADLNLGATATADASLGGDISTDATGETTRIGDATVSATLRGDGDALVPRGFLGVQVNIFPIKLYGQLNTGTDLALQRFGFGGHAGLRVAM